MMAMLNTPFRYVRKGWQRQYSSLITPHQVTQYLACSLFLIAANQLHLRNLNFDCEEIWHAATEVGNPGALESSSSAVLLGLFSPWCSVFFFWLLKFNDFCFVIGGFLVCFFLSESKTFETWTNLHSDNIFFPFWWYWLWEEMKAKLFIPVKSFQMRILRGRSASRVCMR